MRRARDYVFFLFFFQAEDGIRDLTVTGVQTCALPILFRGQGCAPADDVAGDPPGPADLHPQYLPAGASRYAHLGRALTAWAGEGPDPEPRAGPAEPGRHRDRKSTRLNSSHSQISYAVFCLKKKN